jgi:hypothetical protein
VDGKPVDGFDAVIAKPAQYEFYYVFQNSACDRRGCVDKPIISIKTVKVTDFSAPDLVYLLREGDDDDDGKSVIRSDYDAFNRNIAAIPQGFLDTFHVTYFGVNGEKLWTHYPLSRRNTYVFTDLPSGKKPWLKARNYRFPRNEKNLPQCIPFNVKIQRGTKTLYIEITEVEDGTEGSPSKIQRWNLKLMLK